jgi:hypothetical protein
VAIVQVKPQLERLLNLPEDSLTKEVKMCQDLMSLFIEYQIPSDLLAYNGPASGSAPVKVQAVKAYIGNIQAMLVQVKLGSLGSWNVWWQCLRWSWGRRRWCWWCWWWCWWCWWCWWWCEWPWWRPLLSIFLSR